MATNDTNYLHEINHDQNFKEDLNMQFRADFYLIVLRFLRGSCKIS
jgi:hypothetical protein